MLLPSNCLKMAGKIVVHLAKERVCRIGDTDYDIVSLDRAKEGLEKVMVDALQNSAREGRALTEKYQALKIRMRPRTEEELLVYRSYMDECKEKCKPWIDLYESAKSMFLGFYYVPSGKYRDLEIMDSVPEAALKPHQAIKNGKIVFLT